MEQSGVDPEGLATRTQTEPDVVLEWLAGDAQPTKTEFNAIVAMLKRPAAFFLLPRPPAETEIPTAFRHPAGGPRHEATRKELDAIGTARRVQRVARWTAEKVGDRRWADYPAPAVTQNTTVSDAAASVVEWLDWDLEEQRAAVSPAAVVKVVRARLEERGVLALQLPIGQEGCRGFSLYDDVKPLIAVNTAYNAQARLFSYMHEVGHLIRRSDAICIEHAQTAAERWCERFAASFLLPSGDLRERIDERFGPDTTINTLDDVRRLANDFNVSLTATAIRLEDLGWAAGLVAQIPRKSDFREGGGGRGADNTRGAVRARELGEGYISLLLAGVREGALGRQDLLRYLDVSESQLRSTGIRPLAT
jgi:Zn-dependent peptidase ImmA (M78 family)